MTLREYLDEKGGYVGREHGCLYVYYTTDWRLWRLSDYAVSSVCSGRVYLTPRTPPHTPSE